MESTTARPPSGRLSFEAWLQPECKRVGRRKGHARFSRCRDVCEYESDSGSTAQRKRNRGTSMVYRQQEGAEKDGGMLCSSFHIPTPNFLRKCTNNSHRASWNLCSVSSNTSNSSAPNPSPSSSKPSPTPRSISSLIGRHTPKRSPKPVACSPSPLKALHHPPTATSTSPLAGPSWQTSSPQHTTTSSPYHPCLSST